MSHRNVIPARRIMSMIASDPNVSPAFAAFLSAPITFSARVGNRPAFATSQEAVAYERAFADYPNQPWGLSESPAMDGYRAAEWAHAEAAHTERRAVDVLTDEECAAMDETMGSAP